MVTVYFVCTWKCCFPGSCTVESVLFHIEAETAKNRNRCSLSQCEKAEREKKLEKEGKKDLVDLMIPLNGSRPFSSHHCAEKKQCNDSKKHVQCSLKVFLTLHSSSVSLIYLISEKYFISDTNLKYKKLYINFK